MATEQNPKRRSRRELEAENEVLREKVEEVRDSLQDFLEENDDDGE